MIDLGLLVARLVLGVVMAAHGVHKLKALDGTAAGMESLGFRPGRPFALVAGLVELGSGALIALGLLGPLGPALMFSVMIVAGASAHWGKGLFVMNGGIEVPLVYGAGGVAFALTGFGHYSLDALFGIGAYWTPAIAWSALAVGAVGAAANLATRKRVVKAH